MKLKTEQWLRALLAAIITGAATSGSAIIGIGTANAVGMSIAKLDLKQVGVVCLSGGVMGMLAYLKQSPVPPESTGNTDFIKKQALTQTGTSVTTKEP